MNLTSFKISKPISLPVLKSSTFFFLLMSNDDNFLMIIYGCLALARIIILLFLMIRVE